MNYLHVEVNGYSRYQESSPLLIGFIAGIQRPGAVNWVDLDKVKRNEIYSALILSRAGKMKNGSYSPTLNLWRPDFGLEDVPDVRAYCAALRPGNAKLLLRYQVQQLNTNEYALCTETFIYCPDRATQLKMAGYWLAIRLGSGLIRQRTLTAVKHELEKVS
ncbi:hypothetical protein [Buttiauxella gaviniae]